MVLKRLFITTVGQKGAFLLNADERTDWSLVLGRVVNADGMNGLMLTHLV